MGNYLADGLNAGFRAGSDAYNRKKEREQRERELDRRALEEAADRSLRRELLDKDIAARQPLVSAQADHLTANTERTRALTPAELATEQARARGLNVTADRTEALTPGEVAELNARARNINATAAQTETMTPLAADEMRTRNEALRTQAAAGAMAEIEQPLESGGKAKFRVPVAEAQRRADIAAYQSPHADRISQIDAQIAQHQTEMDEGDQRTGLFNAKSRQDEITKLTQRRTRMQALEIQDMLRKGLIDEAEADRRAAKLLSFR